MSGYLYLAIAIVAEVIATTALKAVEGFSKPLPLLLVVTGYGIAVVGQSEEPELAQEFVDLVTSEAGQQILRAAGFAPAP